MSISDCDPDDGSEKKIKLQLKMYIHYDTNLQLMVGKHKSMHTFLKSKKEFKWQNTTEHNSV